MKVSRRPFLLAAFSLVLVCDGAFAHAFAVPYTLPVPFWMYAYGAAGALLISFVVVGLFAKGPPEAALRARGDVAAAASATSGGSALGQGARVLAVLALFLTICTGLFGTQNSFRNFNMTFFWIWFVLGLTYLVALVGDVYAVINPWRTLCDWVERAMPRAFRARLRYPGWLGYYPALVLYMAFIWVELFGHTRPGSLAIILLAYTAVNFAGAALVGRETWFRYGEFFSVFFRLIGKMAPLDWSPGPGARAGDRLPRLRAPFLGLLEARADHFSLLVFVLFMLSSTAFDGLHETLPWVGIFWKGIYPLMEPLVRAASAKPYAVAAEIYYVWQWLSLILSAFVYLAIYLFFIVLVKLAVKTEQSVRELALRFAFALIPIAFVYHLTHYYTLLLSQGVQMIRLVSDPFGVGWNLFATAKSAIQPLLLDASVIWHTQVGLILFGHVVSVYLAHIEAWKQFSNSRRALVSQIPMLVLMVCFTAGGLWILSLPIASGQVSNPAGG